MIIHSVQNAKHRRHKPAQSPSTSTTNTTGQLCILLFSFQFPLFLWTKLGLFALFSFAFIFFSFITHICFSLLENDLYFLTCPRNKTHQRIKARELIHACSLSQNPDMVNPGLFQCHSSRQSSGLITALAVIHLIFSPRFYRGFSSPENQRNLRNQRQKIFSFSFLPSVFIHSP